MRISDWREELKPDTWIDVKNPKGKWCLGLIRELEKEKIHVEYDGYSSDCNEVFPFIFYSGYL